jgi:enolase
MILLITPSVSSDSLTMEEIAELIPGDQYYLGWDVQEAIWEIYQKIEADIQAEQEEIIDIAVEEATAPLLEEIERLEKEKVIAAIIGGGIGLILGLLIN